MGMDVYGVKPKTSKGEYFRNNVWWWHPLWTYCCYTCPELANKVESGHDNSGDGLDAVDSRRLGFIIQESITTGAAQEYVDLYNKDITHMKISNRNSILKYYQTYKYTSIFIDIGKLESKTRMKICNKLEDITNIDHLIKIKTKINELNCINEELPDLDNIYKTIKRKKVQINNKEIKNIIKVSSLPIDKYGIRLFINKSYVQLNEKFSKYILTHYSY